MNRRRVACSAAVLLLWVGPVHAQQCLHGSDEHPLEKDRRTLALNAVRVINTAESGHIAQYGRYVPMAELAQSPAMRRFQDSAGRFGVTYRLLSLQPNTDILYGFELHLLTDGITYTMTLKDKTDPCRFAYVSDQAGLIYTSYPIDLAGPPLPR